MPDTPEISSKCLPRASLLVPWTLAAGCLLVAAWAVAQFIVLRSENRTLSQRESLLKVALRASQAQLEAEQIIGERALAELKKSESTARCVTLLTSPGVRGNASAGAVTWSTVHASGSFSARALSGHGGDRYELWTTRPARTRLASFAVGPSGEITLSFQSPEPLPGDAAFAVYPAAVSGSTEPPKAVLQSGSR